MRQASAFIAAVLLSISAFPQDTLPRSTESFAKSRAAHPITSEAPPYSAEQLIEIVRPQLDGSRLTEEPPPTKLYRDSQGRTRQESLRRPPDSPVIVDPVAHLQYVLDVANKIAHRQRLRPAQERVHRSDIYPDQDSRSTLESSSQSNNGDSAPTAPQVTTDHLGAQTMEGLRVEGTKITTLWPNGLYGRGKPDSDVTEIWVSPQLQTAILRKFTSTRNGERVEKLVNISLKEPSPELFRPPPDYRIVDDTEESTPQTAANEVNAGSGRGFKRVGQAQPPQRQDLGPNPDANGVYRIEVGGSVSAPVRISGREPEYSEEARAAKLSGSVLLSFIIDADGVTRDIKVIRPLGMGLDEKAIEAVGSWRFRPALRDGKPVAVRSHAEVAFRLL